MKNYGYSLNKLIENGTVKEVRKVTKADQYEVGKFYWSGYWQDFYKVEKVNVKVKKNPKGVTISRIVSVDIKWRDGHTGTSYTSLDVNRDYILTMNDQN